MGDKHQRIFQIPLYTTCYPEAELLEERSVFLDEHNRLLRGAYAGSIRQGPLHPLPQDLMTALSHHEIEHIKETFSVALGLKDFQVFQRMVINGEHRRFDTVTMDRPVPEAGGHLRLANGCAA